MNQAIRLKPEQLYRRCNTDAFTFDTTEELTDIVGAPGQQRAIEAIRFGIGVRSDGYNLYALGELGIGRRSLIEHYLKEAARQEPTPPDWVYVNNFRDHHKPKALELPTGQGKALKEDLQQLLEDLQTALPVAFESEEYRSDRKELEEELHNEQGRPFEQLSDKAKQLKLGLIRTARGMAFAPINDEGDVMPAENFNQLPEQERARIHKDIEKLEGELEKIFHQVPRWQREGQRKIRELDRSVSRRTVEALLEDLRLHWQEHAGVQAYLDAVRDDVIDHLTDFLGDSEEKPTQTLFGTPHSPSLRRYNVNALVDNSTTDGAPIVIEDHPSVQNLFGRIEHLSQMGNLFTDFTLIKGGALHRANGGYLVLEVHKLLMQPFAWETLKRTLKAKALKVESIGQELSLISTVTLQPEAINLSVKVILVGSRLHHYLLSQFDPEFNQLFKVMVDFEDHLPWSEAHQLSYAQMIATLCRHNALLPLDRSAVARAIEQGARETNEVERLSLHRQSLTDLLRESDFWARDKGKKVITAAEVQATLNARRQRSGRIPERLQEAIQRGTLLITTDGEAIGQINGLSVSDSGHSRFGHASRITARVRLGGGEIKDIQREVKMAGPIFSKAVLTLTGYLGAHYAEDFPLMLGASLVFEQTYSGIEGDSATAAELLALISALSRVPLRQGLAVTGSANQYGEIQAIGGVNEKIEGFYDSCEPRGLTGQQGVLIPAANVRNLMLREDVVTAVQQQRFHIYSFAHIDEGLALLTGMPAGERRADGRFTPDSVNDRVQQRLLSFAEQAKRWGKPTADQDKDDP